MSSNISYVYQSRARNQPAIFYVEPSTILHAVMPDPALRAEHVTIDPLETVIDNVPQLSCAGTNTDRKESEGRGMYHREGGWPASVDCGEIEETIKLCKREERSDEYIVAVQRLARAMEEGVKLNCAVDIYGSYWGDTDAPTDPWVVAPPTKGGAAGSGGAGGGGGGSGGAFSSPRGLRQSGDASTLGSALLGMSGGGIDSSDAFADAKAVGARYTAPQVVSELHVASKFDRGSIDALGTSFAGLDARAMQCSWTCGSEATRIAIAYTAVDCGFASFAPSYGPPPTLGVSNVAGLGTAPLLGGASSNAVAFAASLGAGNSSSAAAAAIRRLSAGVSGARDGGPGIAPSRYPVSCVLWDVTSPAAPNAVLYSPHGGSSSVACSGKDPNIIVAGTPAGVIQFWDARQSTGLPVAASPREHSHRGAVTDVKYLMSKGIECFSSAVDGCIHFWDVRSLTRPLPNESVDLGAYFASSAYLSTPGALPSPCGGALCIDFDPLVGGAQKYLVGCADGSIAACSRRGKTPSEKITTRYQASYGPVSDVCRNHANPKVFAAVGDWGFRLFGDEVRHPLLSSPHGRSLVSCGKWLPMRSLVLVAGTRMGSLEFWDLLHSHVQPAMRLALGSSAVQHVSPHPAGRLVAACSSDGAVNIVALPRLLAEGFRGERSATISFLEAEHARERAAQGKAALSARRATAVGSVGTGASGVQGSVLEWAAASATGGDGPLGADAGSGPQFRTPSLEARSGSLLMEQLAALESVYLAEVGALPGGSSAATGAPPSSPPTPQ